MAREKTRNTGKGKHPTKLKDQRLKAKKLYLKNYGEISLEAIAKKVKVHVGTIYRWRTEDEWYKAVEKIKEAAEEKTVERYSTSLADEVDVQNKQINEAMKGIGKLVVGKLFERDEKGRNVLSEDGRPLPNWRLSAKELQTLSNQLLNWQKQLLLYAGRSTKNVGIAGELKVNGKGDGSIPVKRIESEEMKKANQKYNNILDEIADTGAHEKQQKLMEIFQGITELYSEE